MKERPIIFSGPMVRAILNGQKTQTRRIVKRVPCEHWIPEEMDVVTPEGWQWIGHSGNWSCECCSAQPVKCPYGKPGDRLWVRETWSDYWMHEDDAYGEPCGGGLDYRATWNPKKADKPKWKPSIHMPRWASRITLVVVAVWVERLQDISNEDAKAEGVEKSLAVEMKDGSPCYDLPFQLLWESIHGVGSWNQNPWVWVVEFKRMGGKS